MKCEKMVSKVDWYVSFNVKVTTGDGDELLDPDINPCNVFVRTCLDKHAVMNRSHSRKHLPLAYPNNNDA